MNDNLLCTVEALNCTSTKMIKADYYRNSHGVWGYYFLLWRAEHYHFISISKCENKIPTLAEVAYAIQGIDTIRDGKWGFYENKKGVLGFYASAESTRSFDNADHWYMMGRSNDRQTLGRMAKERQVPEEVRDLLDHINRESFDRKRAS